jgi:hypothetical protein
VDGVIDGRNIISPSRERALSKFSLSLRKTVSSISLSLEGRGLG